MSADHGRSRWAVRLRDPEQLGDHGDRQWLGVIGDQVHLAAPAEVVDEAVDDRLDPRSERLHRPGSERPADESSQARVVGRLEVEHPGVVELVERGVPGGRLRPAEVGVRGHVEIRPAQAPVAQQTVDVLVARDHPLPRLVVPEHGMLVPQAPVGRIRVRDELRIMGPEADVGRADGRGTRHRRSVAEAPGAARPGRTDDGRSTRPYAGGEPRASALAAHDTG